MKVIILNGVARAGKDTLADHIILRANSTDDTYAYSLSTVDEVKKICKYFGVGEEKTDADRKLWSDVKDLWTAYNNGPFNDIIEKIGYLYNGEDTNSIYIVMCREPEEIAKFKRHYGDDCYTVLVERSDLPVPDNHADQNVYDYEYMYYVENNGTIEDLLDSAEALYDEFFNVSIDDYKEIFE